MHPKDKILSQLKQKIVYKLSCPEENCNLSYTGESSRCVENRVKDHNIHCCISCLIEDNMDVCLYAYLLLCANNSICSKCVCLYVQMWCTLADYIHDANRLYYLH